jgi:Ca2+-binding EF-hand superfamily protein
MKKFACLIAMMGFASMAVGQDLDSYFAGLDTDKDGKISKEEASGNDQLTMAWDMVDADKDTFITLEELKKAAGGG